MKRLKKKISKKNFKKNLFLWAFFAFVFLVLIYLFFFKTNSTGNDYNFVNRSEIYSRDGSLDDSQNDSPAYIPLNNIDLPQKTSSKDSSPNIAPVQYPQLNLTNIFSNDSDAFELNGNVVTENFFSKGICKDEKNEAGLEDFCTGEFLTEYYLSGEECLSKEISCGIFEGIYKENTQTSCYLGECIVKDGGMNFFEMDQMIAQEVYFDECIEDGSLKEWFISQEGIPSYTLVNCSESYGEDYQCHKGACKEIFEVLPETEAVDSDAQDFYNFGTCYAHEVFYMDHCTEYGSLIEYVVDPEDSTSCYGIDTYCPTGICSSGKCVVIDYDAQYSSFYEIQSECTVNFESNVTDSCNCLDDGNICRYLKEWSVLENQCVSEVVDCRIILDDENAYCSSGKCAYPRVSR